MSLSFIPRCSQTTWYCRRASTCSRTSSESRELSTMFRGCSWSSSSARKRVEKCRSPSQTRTAYFQRAFSNPFKRLSSRFSSVERRNLMQWTLLQCSLDIFRKSRNLPFSCPSLVSPTLDSLLPRTIRTQFLGNLKQRNQATNTQQRKGTKKLFPWDPGRNVRLE